MSEVQDWFMLMLERMARALGLALSKLIGLKQENRLEEANEFIAQYLQSDFDLKISELLDVENEELVTYLQSNKFHNSHLETLAKILTEYAETLKNIEEQKNAYLKAEYLFHYLSTNDKTFSVDRQFYINKIKKNRRAISLKNN